MQAMNENYEFNYKFSRNHILKVKNKQTNKQVKLNLIIDLTHIQNIIPSTCNHAILKLLSYFSG